MNSIDKVLLYHEVTKHHPYRFARALGYLDWDNQPNPFRRFSGAPVYQFPLFPATEEPLYDDLFSGLVRRESLTVNSLSRLFRNAFAISAWKRAEDTRWSLRVNPSSGALHPTESYAVTGGIDSLPSGVYHYTPLLHALEQRAKLADFTADYFLIGLSTVHWREAWKYGERAYRYCQHDLGHALGALRLSAALLGWQAVCLDHLGEDEVAFLLGLSRPEDFHEAEDEHPECLIAIRTGENPADENTFFSLVSNAEWFGHANRLSESHWEWEIIYETARAAFKPGTTRSHSKPLSSLVRVSPVQHQKQSAEKIIQQRRSCLSLDARTRITKESFLRMLERTIPERTAIPFDLLDRSVLNRPRIHFGLFVHRVDDLVPGLYFLIRNPGSESEIKSILKPQFPWTAVAAGFPLYLLEEGDFTRMSSGIACGQDLAGDGAFSLGMIAEFEDAIRTTGGWLYPRLFWEAGLVGQILYLEAEAAGIRSTGIGCYFDDPMHELLGIGTGNRKLQSLYHFTVGGPVEDTRLTTEPAYP